MISLKGLVTGIGSLPHIDSAGAVDLVLRFCPKLPFWPQLPKRSLREGMVGQFAEGLPGLEFTHQGITFNLKDKDKQLEIFYERIIGQDKKHFAISDSCASGLYELKRRLQHTGTKDIVAIKCHITGPFTFGASLKDEQGIPLLHDSTLRQAIVKGLIMKGLWQIDFFKEFNKPMIIFIDEPYLSGFGSAFTPLSKEEVVLGLKEVAQGLKSNDILVGVHCCGNTDWSIFTEVPEIDIINFDATGFLDSFLLYVENINDFLKKGGFLCWGVVPTQLTSDLANRDFFVSQFLNGLQRLIKKGLERQLLQERIFFSPACGLGALDISNAEAVLALLSQVVEKINYLTKKEKVL